MSQEEETLDSTLGDSEASTTSSMNSSSNDSQPPPQRRVMQGGWGDGTSTTTSTTSTTSFMSEASTSSSSSTDGPVGFGRRAGKQQEQAKGNKYDINDTITDITEIPDLEEPAGEDITTQVAEAPNVRTTRVQNLQDLDKEIMFSLPSNVGDGIDLSILTMALSPQESLTETDSHWEVDQMFGDIASEVQLEQEPIKEEGEEDEEDDDTANAKAKTKNNTNNNNNSGPTRDRTNVAQQAQVV